MILSNDALIAGFAAFFVRFVAACLDVVVDQRFARRFADAPLLMNVDLFVTVLSRSVPAFVPRLFFFFQRPALLSQFNRDLLFACF